MLRILAKFNTFFARLPLKGKVVFFVLVALLFTVMAVLPTVNALNRRIFPLFKAEQEFYVDLRPTTGLAQHQDVLAASLSSLSNLSREEVSLLVSAMFSSEPSRFGSYKEGSRVVFYVRNPLRPVVLGESLSSAGWNIQEHRLGRDQYVLLSAHEGSAIPADAKLNGLWAKFGLYRRAEQDRGVMYLRPKVDQPSLYGVFSEGENAWQMRFSASSWSFGDRIETVFVPVDALFHLRNNAPLPGIEDFPWPLDVRSLLEGPLAPLLAPGSLTAYAGAFAQLVENPFDDTLSWESIRVAEAVTATSSLQRLLESLMVRYPMAYERVLPDNSKVFELKKGADQFLPPGATVDVQSNPEGVLTYPRDQIRYRFSGDVLTIQKGADSSNLNETMEISCGLPEAKLEFFATADFMATPMWKRMFFALNQRNGVVCIFW